MGSCGKRGERGVERGIFQKRVLKKGSQGEENERVEEKISSCRGPGKKSRKGGWNKGRVTKERWKGANKELKVEAEKAGDSG